MGLCFTVSPCSLLSSLYRCLAFWTLRWMHLTVLQPDSYMHTNVWRQRDISTATDVLALFGLGLFPHFKVLLGCWSSNLQQWKTYPHKQSRVEMPHCIYLRLQYMVLTTIKYPYSEPNICLWEVMDYKVAYMFNPDLKCISEKNSPCGLTCPDRESWPEHLQRLGETQAYPL